MPKRSSALVGALILGSVLGAVRAQAQPFGFIDSPAPGQQGLSGSVPVIGWVADASGVINHVDFLVDGRVVAGSVGSGLPSTALFGTPRPDVFAAFPNIPNSFNSGFVANIDTTAFIDGVHVILGRHVSFAKQTVGGHDESHFASQRIDGGCGRWRHAHRGNDRDRAI